MAAAGGAAPARRTALITVMGTRGDVQPFVALGLHLQRSRGWRVVLAAPPEFRKFVEGWGLEHEDIGLSLQVGSTAGMVAARCCSPVGTRHLASACQLPAAKRPAPASPCWPRCHVQHAINASPQGKALRTASVFGAFQGGWAGGWASF